MLLETFPICWHFSMGNAFALDRWYRVKIYSAVLRYGLITPRVFSLAHSDAPFSICRQPIRLSFNRTQPFTERLRIIPAHIHCWVRRALFKVRLSPFSIGVLAKRPVVLHSRFPDAHLYIGAREWDQGKRITH